MSSMIVCPEPEAAAVGRDIFAAGGNVMDAAIAAAFVQTVSNPMSCGVAGSGLLHHYNSATRAGTIINCRASTGSRPVPKHWAEESRRRTETVGRYLVSGHANNMGYQSVMTPGFVRGCWEAYQRFSSHRLSWAELLSPSVRLARDGFELSSFHAGHWKGRGPGSASPGVPDTLMSLTATPDASRIYLKNGAPYEAGDWLEQPELAQTIERLADVGAEDFYVGEIAQAIAQDFEANGGFITSDDLRDYAVDIHQPRCGSYRGLTVASPPYDSGPQLIQLLQILDRFDLSTLEHNSPQYIDTVARIQRATFADSVRLKGRGFDDQTQLVQESLSQERAQYWADLINGGDRILVREASHPSGTTNLTCVGDDLSVVSFTHSIGNGAGSGVVTPGLGFLYNDFLGHFNPVPGYPDSIEPRKKTSGGPPTIVFKNDQPYIAVGGSGGSRQMTSIFQAIVNVIDHGMDMRTSVTVPRFHSEQEQLVFLEPDIPEAVAEALADLGNDVTRSTYMARVQAIRIRPEDRSLDAGSDPRGGSGVGIHP